MTTFDPDAFKASTRDQWDAAAEAWHRWGPTIESWLAASTAAMLDDCRLDAGSRVLDIAAGAGGQTLEAARRVGPTGHVLATDISPGILAFARLVAEANGLSNVETLEADGETLGALPAESFDAAISRVGLIFFPDRLGALNGICRTLRPGGRFSTVAYSTPANNAFFSIPIGIVRRVAGLPAPEPGLPGPFSLGSPGVAEALYADAGLVDVTVTTVDSPVRLPTTADFVLFARESFGALHQMLLGVDQEARAGAWQEIEETLSQFEGPDGFAGPCELLVVSGTRP